MKMSIITLPKMFLAATAALVAVPAASALLSTYNAHSSHKQLFGRPSFLTLEAKQQPFSELDKLKAKRLSLRRTPEPEVEATVESHDLEDVTNNSLMAGLEYLYEAGEERHSDDLFHIILMPSTFHKDHMSIGIFDEAGEERHSDDLFHIILMPSTFHKDHMSIENTAQSCTEILGIPSDKAQDLSLFAKHQGFSCLGTWTREECLSIGEELLSRDLDCRIIPFNGGGVIPKSVPESSVAAMDVSVQIAVVENTYLLSLGS
eukprot:CAMPEP_0201944746 /NCGR_PEP_ID=MMETSP0903-20130614/53550_1 /ASSEMBLY_ACC=CAM_ASM_000552 /TAXON_ID=420261 /ORGANISM="Thalassiosira antarctica, Strain CCMP982" /LENGTH=260 /DNA_ID=CAMNT_0048487801 /DNA_START=528 /DNA_END=1311 /DNA_ORIENTATION=+